MCGFSSGGGDNSQEQQAQENRRQNSIVDGSNSINNAFSSYNPAYYKNYEDNYVAQAQPDLDKQQRNATQDGLFYLARSGQTKGSAASKVYGDITAQRANEDLAVAGQARDASDALRTSVSNEQSNLIQQLNATADSAGAAQQATIQSATLNRPAVYSPISNAFADITGALANNEVARRAGYQGYGFGISSTNKATNPLSGSASSVTQV